MPDNTGCNARRVVNIGSGVALAVADLAETIARVVGYKGTLRFVTSKPDRMWSSRAFRYNNGWTILQRDRNRVTHMFRRIAPG